MFFRRISVGLIAAIFVAFSLTARAEVPDAGSIMREIGDKPKALPERKPDLPAKPTPPPSAVQQGPKVLVKGFRITGTTLFNEAELQALLVGYVGRELDFAEISQATQQIAAYYTARGYMAQVTLPPQELKDGIIVIQVLEGKLGAVEINPLRGVRFSRERATDFITGRQPVGEPLKTNALEEGLMLLNDNPGIVASAVLQPGASPGTTNVVVNLDRGALLSGSLDFDNNGSVSTGEYRLTASLNINNPAGFGDHISIKGLSSLENNYGRIAYTLPLGTAGTRLVTNVSILHYQLGGDLVALYARGNALTTGTSLSHPIVHTRSGNPYGTMGYEFRTYDNHALARETSNKMIHAGSGGFSGDWYDTLLGGGYTSMSATVTVGDLDLSNNGTDMTTDAAGPKASGGYSKVSYSMSRLQNIYKNQTTFWLSLNGQFSDTNLDSSEKISLGGPSAVRSLPPNDGSGDFGFIFSAELRQNITDTVQIFGFYDLGWLRQHHSVYSGWNGFGGAPNNYDTDGVGIGLTWVKPGSFSIKGTLAQRLGSNPAMNAQGNDSDGTLREPRFWLQTNIYF